MSVAAYASETNKSTTILPRLGLVISWTKPWSSRQSVNFRVNLEKRHVGNRQLCSQSNPGRFISPAIQICDEVSPLNRWSDLSKFSKLMVSPSHSGLTSKFPGRGYQVWEGDTGVVKVRIRNLIFALQKSIFDFDFSIWKFAFDIDFLFFKFTCYFYARFRRRPFHKPNLIYWIKYIKGSASESIRNACFNLERLSRSFRLAQLGISTLDRLWNVFDSCTEPNAQII